MQYSDYVEMEQSNRYLKASITSYVAANQKLDEALQKQGLEIIALKVLLKMAGCPEMLIEHPGLFSSIKPSKEDIEWTYQKIQEHEINDIKNKNSHH